MRVYGHAPEVAQQIIAQFQAGTLPRSLAPVFLQRDDTPCRKWSWTNRLLVALAGYSDARGMKQWNDVNRRVKKGQKALHILAPIVVKSKDQIDDEGHFKTLLVGYKAVPVYGYEQTEGQELADRKETRRFLENLPLRAVAETWGLRLSTYDGSHNSATGWYSPGRQAIGLGVQNLATWAHELVHAADDRLGTLKEKGQHWQSETVAELGGATLLCAMGYSTDADLGGAWRYISEYAQAAQIEPIQACLSVLSRVCEAVDLILKTAATLNTTGSQDVAA